MEVKIVGVGEFRSFKNEDHAGFLRVEGPSGGFDLPVSEQQLSMFLQGVFAEEAHPDPETQPEAPLEPAEATAPSFGDEFDLGDEAPLRLAHSIDSVTPFTYEEEDGL
jgi:hypothetical protein